MSNDQLFQLANALVLPAWLLLAFLPRWQWTGRIVVGIIVSMLSLLYVFLVLRSIQVSDFADFSSLDGITKLFSEPGAVLAGWIHYLAFDLMTGWYIVKNGEQHQINQWLRLPCLLFTFMLGPSGLLLYFLIRWGVNRRYFLE